MFLGHCIDTELRSASNKSDGDLLSLNQGRLYPVLLRLEQEGAIESSWGASEPNRRARYYRLTREGRRQLQAEVRDLASDKRDQRAVSNGESGATVMRVLRRLWKRMRNFARSSSARRVETASQLGRADG